MSSDYHATVAARHNKPLYRTEFDPEVVVARSHLTILHADNRYQAWPLFTYLTANPDNFPGLGRPLLVKYPG